MHELAPKVPTAPPVHKQLSPRFRLLAVVLFSSLFSGIATAIQGVAAAVWYFDCRARREGIDLAARLEELRAETALPAGAAP